MIIDSSVLVCLFADEPERTRLAEALLTADVRRMSAGTVVELSAVAIRKRQFDVERLNAFLDGQSVLIEPVTPDHARIGQQAYQRFGRGTGHRACLNFGDCFTYALAKATGEPLLFKGDDFNHTDLKLAAESAYPR